MPAHAYVEACIALGSNVGDRAATLHAAIASLERTPGVEVLATAGHSQTPPVGPPGQGPYLNSAAVIRTSLSPRQLLDTLLRIEQEHGRTRPDPVRWGPRTLDLDLLLFADRIIDEPGLRVPHPRLHERSFVLGPLAEIAPGWIVPTLGASVRELAARVASPTH